MSSLNLLDVAKLNGSDAVVGLIEEVITEVPEIALFPARTVLGTSFKTVTRTGLPGVAFRAANEGVSPGKSTFITGLAEMFLLDGQIEGDKKVFDADERGPDRMKALEAIGVAKAALIHLIGQIFYGESNDTKGFQGLKNFSAFGGEYTLNAGGTTGSTASSIFGVRFGEQDASLLFGTNTTLTLGEWRTQQINDSLDSTKKLTAYVNDLGGWVGLQLASKWSCGRIANITADAGKTATEDKLINWLELFPAQKQPTHIFMSKRSMTQIRLDMTPSITLKGTALGGKSVTPAAAKAAIEESTGAIVIVSDNITNTDAIGS
jgi:hypothetical protein